MREKARVTLILAMVGLFLGGLFYFFKIYQPNQARATAQVEIEAWEQRWTEARACLLGTAPASLKADEAIAVREMLPDPWERQTCTRLIGKLARGVTDDTGIMPVERAWMAIDSEVSKVANAFAMHVDPFGRKAENGGKDAALPDALDELERAHARLREAAGMAPPSAERLPPLPAAELIEIKVGSDRVMRLDHWSLPSANGAIAWISIEGRGEAQLVLVPGAAPRVTKRPRAAVAAVPDASWAAEARFDSVSIAPLDAGGALGASTALYARGSAMVHAAVGSFVNGLVAYTSGAGLTFARASAGKPFMADKAIEVSTVTSAIDTDGRAVVAWETQDGFLHGTIVKDGSPPTVVELGSGSPEASCLTATHGWIRGGDQFVAFDATAARSHVLPLHDLLGCAKEAALLHEHETSRYAVCQDECRVVTLQNLVSTEVATIVGGKLLAVRANGPVIGLWQENAPPRFFATKLEVAPILAISDGKVIDILGMTEDGAVIARVTVR